MKKLLITMSLALFINRLSALPALICTSGGYLFEVYWFINSAGQLDFILESQGPGSCTGGPWQMQFNMVNPQVNPNDQPPVATAELNNRFSRFVESTPVDQNDANVKEAMALSHGNTTPAYSFNPNNIHPSWAKSFAVSTNLSIYYLKLNSNPTVNHTLNFELWSVKTQTVQLKLISATTGAVVWSSTTDLAEAKNLKNISVGNIGGNFVLQIISGGNTLNANIVVN